MDSYTMEMCEHLEDEVDSLGFHLLDSITAHSIKPDCYY